MTAQHLYRPGNQWGVTVSELVARISAEGLPIRLMWPDTDPDVPFSRVRWSLDDCPTGYLPKIDEPCTAWPGTRSA